MKFYYKLNVYPIFFPTGVLGGFYLLDVDLYITWEEQLQSEKMHPKDWSMGKSVSHFLD